jgi:chromosome segregation ATPase
VTAADIEADAVAQNEKLGRSVTTQGREITALKRRAEAAEAKLAEAQNAVVSLSGEVTRLERELVDEAEKETAWTGQMQRDLNERAEKIASQEADLERMRTYVVRARGEAARQAQEMSEASAQAAMANKARIHATEQLARKTAEAETARQRLAYAATRRDEAGRELEAHRAASPGRGRKARAGYAAEERYLTGKLEAFASVAAPAVLEKEAGK